jgi:hypothetical protein
VIVAGHEELVCGQHVMKRRLNAQSAGVCYSTIKLRGNKRRVTIEDMPKYCYRSGAPALRLFRMSIVARDTIFIPSLPHGSLTRSNDASLTRVMI